jgi:hypothetical protein
MKASATITVLLGLALLAAVPAQSAPPCGDAVVSDWTDGRIDGRYAPRCYGDALEALPEDVRAYSTAEDDIAVALRARIRELRTRASASEGAATSAANAGGVPVALLSEAAIALALGLAALARLVGHRLRERFAHRPARPIGQW